MIVGEPDELKGKVTISWQMLIWAGAILVFVGYLWAEIKFSYQEVDGLRSDWERELIETHRRLEELEGYHKKTIN